MTGRRASVPPAKRRRHICDAVVERAVVVPEQRDAVKEYFPICYSAPVRRRRDNFERVETTAILMSPRSKVTAPPAAASLPAQSQFSADRSGPD
jgi:hypothetical protein